MWGRDTISVPCWCLYVHQYVCVLEYVCVSVTEEERDREAAQLCVRELHLPVSPCGGHTRLQQDKATINKCLSLQRNREKRIGFQFHQEAKLLTQSFIMKPLRSSPSSCLKLTESLSNDSEDRSTGH